MLSTATTLLSTTLLLLLLLLTTTTHAHPFYMIGPGPDAPPGPSSPPTTTTKTTTTTTTTITAPQLLLIAPKSTTCPASPYSTECRTAPQAALALTSSFTTYNITSPPEQAALLSLIAYETDDFRYNTNHYPGRPGQGTRNMQMPRWNLLYAESLPAIAPRLAAIPATDVDAVRALLLERDEVDFGSAAWFLVRQCGEEVRMGLRSGGRKGWERYLVGCVGAEVSGERLEYWERAGRALGVAGV